ncbi:MAG: radical SAM protein [Bacteroidales bacterium]|jgi:hypothetical protein|nr:radical SAM protein [Bacteroidales bacterium]
MSDFSGLSSYFPDLPDAPDWLDLKVALLHCGVNVDEAVYNNFEGCCRLSRNPYSCNAMILGGEVSCSLARVTGGEKTPFRLTVDDGKPVITCNGRPIVRIAFHANTSFYDQQTSGGIPFGSLAVIQGWDMLAFSCLWRCEITQSGDACGFCHTGIFSVPDHSLSEMAEVVRYAVNNNPGVGILQLTAGSTFRPEAEIDRYVRIMETLGSELEMSLPPTIIYLTPPSDLKQLDRLFDAGVSQIACDMDIWDERLFNRICPGKARVNTRQRYLDALHYIADRYGPNRACCVFVGGIEPADSLLEGATRLARCGIVPLPSPLMPFGITPKTLPEIQPFNFGYYRKVRRETARLYRQYNLVVPGTRGSDVCLSRDIWLRRETECLIN